MPVLSPAVYINELHLQKKTVRESSNSLFLPIVSSFVFLLPMRITFPKSQHLIQKKGLTCSATKPEIYCSGFVGVPSHHFDIIAKKTFRKLTFIIYFLSWIIYIFFYSLQLDLLNSFRRILTIKIMDFFLIKSIFNHFCKFIFFTSRHENISAI